MLCKRFGRLRTRVRHRKVVSDHFDPPGLHKSLIDVNVQCIAQTAQRCAHVSDALFDFILALGRPLEAMPTHIQRTLYSARRGLDDLRLPTVVSCPPVMRLSTPVLQCQPRVVLHVTILHPCSNFSAHFPEFVWEGQHQQRYALALARVDFGLNTPLQDCPRR